MIFDRLRRHFEYSCLRVACVIEYITVSNLGLLYVCHKHYKWRFSRAHTRSYMKFAA
jgi:hypothetical protein